MADNYNAFLDSVAGGKLDDVIGYRPKPVAAIAPRASDVGGFKNAFAQSIGSTVEGVGRLAGDFVPGVSQDNAMQRFGAEYAAAHPTAIHSWEDIKASPWLATKEALGGAAGFMLPMVATAPVGGALRLASGAGKLAAVSRGAGRAISSKAGQIATMTPAPYAGIREAQGPDAQAMSDKLLALGGASASGAIETMFGPQQWAMGALKKEGREALAKKFGDGSLLKRTGVGVVKGAAIEGGEELVQNPIEQLAGYQNPLTEESLSQTGFGASMGILAGGVMGGGFGAISRKHDLTQKEPPAPPVEPTPTGQMADMFGGTPADPYKAAMDEAVQATSPATFRADYYKQIMAASPTKDAGAKEVATEAAFSTPEARENYVYLRRFGMAREDAIRQALVSPPLAPAPQTNLFAPQKGRAAKPTGRVPKIADGARPTIAPAPPENPLVAAAPTKAGKKAVADYNQRLAAGQLTQAQHEELVNDVHNDVEVGKVNSAMRRMLKENKNAVQKQSAAGKVPRTRAAGEAVAEGREGMGQGEPGTEVAEAGKAEKALIAFETKLPKQQRAVFNLLRAAVESGDLEKYVTADGGMQAQAIATALGLGARGKVSTAIKQLQAKLNAAGGGDVKTALMATATAKRVTEGGDYERLGLSPAQQAVTASEEEYLGGEGREQSMGLISSIGGSQSATGANVAGPLARAEREIETAARDVIRRGGEQAPEIVMGVPNEAAIAAAKQSKISAIVEGLRTGDLTDAIAAWNDIATKIEGLAPIPTDLSSITMDDQTLDALNEVLGAYQQVMEDESLAMETRRSFDTEGAYEIAFRDVIRARTVNAPKLVADARTAEDRLFGTEPETRAGAEPAGDQSAEAVKAANKERFARERAAAGTWEFPEQPAVAKPEPSAVKVTTKKRRVAGPKTDLAETGPMENANTKASLDNFLEGLFRSSTHMAQIVTVYETQAEAAAKNADLNFSEVKTRIGGFKTMDGKIGLIAEHIAKGQELGIVLHEIGVHLGMEKLVGKANMEWLQNRVRSWAKLADGSLENLAAVQAVRRAEASSSLHKEEELIAYMVTELINRGVNPRAFSATSVGRWFNRLMRALKVAMRKLGLKRIEFSGQNLIDLAYGAAEIAMDGSALVSDLQYERAKRIVSTVGTTSNSMLQRNLHISRQSAETLLAKMESEGFIGPKNELTGIHKVVSDAQLAEVGAPPRPIKYGSKFLFERAERVAKKKGYTSTSVEYLPSGEVLVTRIKRAVPAAGTMFAEVSPMVDPKAPNAGVWSAVGTAFDKFLSDPVNMLKVHGLGWLSLAHLVEVSKRVNPEIAGYQAAMQRMQTMEKHWVQKAAKIDVEWGNIKDATQTKTLHTVMREATREGFDPSDVKADPANAAQRAIKADYSHLLPAARKVYADARDHYAQVRQERQTIMTGAIEAAYKNRIAEANKVGDTEKTAKYEKKLSDEVANLRKMYAAVKGPYFPLLRLGEWYAVGMSKELAALVDKADKTEADEARIAKLRKDPEHYRTKSFDRQSQAKAEMSKMEQEFDVARYNVASERNQATSVLSAAGLKEVEDYIASTFDPRVAGEIKDMMSELYYQSLPENSVLKRELRREGVHGEEEDMRRVFAVTSLRNAHYLSRMKHSDSVKSAMYSALQTAKQNGPDAMQMYNEIAKRAKIAMEQNSTPIADLLTTGSYLAHLGMSPAFFLTNATQVPMITMPWLAARSNPAAATSAIGSAYKKAYNIIRSSYSEQGWRAELDWSGKVTDSEGRMLTELLEHNLLNITMEHDLGVVAAGARYTVGGRDISIGDAMKIGNLPIHITELANRSVTALAAYNVATGKGMQHSSAVEFAANAVSDTQLDYSALNAPRHMQRVGGSAALAKITMQFRKYQQGMMWLICKNVFDGLISKNATADERRAAQRTLAGLFTTTGIMAGTLGLPMAGTATFIATMVASAFGADDEPWDAEVEYRNWLTELLGKDAAEAVTTGIPAWMFNADLSKRVGMSDIASPLPFMRQGKTTKDTAGNILLSMAGAPVATVVDMVDGVVLMHRGEWAKGAEKVIPLKLAQNIVKAGRYEYEGMSKANGEIVLPPDKFSAADIMLRGLGISTATESAYYEGTQAVEKAKAAVKDVRTRLLANYAQAKIAGNPTADIRTEIRKFNLRHPQKGIRIDPASMSASEKMRRKAARERGASGVSTSKANKPYMSEAEFAI